MVGFGPMSVSECLTVSTGMHQCDIQLGKRQVR